MRYYGHGDFRAKRSLKALQSVRGPQALAPDFSKRSDEIPALALFPTINACPMVPVQAPKAIALNFDSSQAPSTQPQAAQTPAANAQGVTA